MILTDDQAREAAMNGRTVQLRHAPPYLPCPLCGGDGTYLHPYAMECLGSHDAGWETTEDD